MSAKITGNQAISAIIHIMLNSYEILPKKFLEKLPEIIGEDNLRETLNSFCFKKPSTFRVNTLKITSKGLIKELNQIGINVKPVDWYQDAFILDNVEQKILSETRWYKEGFLYIQGLSSMIPPLILNPEKNEKVLDLCAAPGSKTTQTATLMKNTGEITANDLSRIRNFKLNANLKLQGVTNTQTTNMLGELIWKKYPEFFDKTLVDVPCSMEGRFSTNDPKTYKDWKNGKVKQLSQKQKFLLRSAISATKIGGIIIYSTCTLSPEENEEVINWILEKEKNNIELLPITLNNYNFSQGLTSFKNKIYSLELSKTKRILPTKIMEGFYIAKLKKIKSNITF